MKAIFERDDLARLAAMDPAARAAALDLIGRALDVFNAPPVAGPAPEPAKPPDVPAPPSPAVPDPANPTGPKWPGLLTGEITATVDATDPATYHLEIKLSGTVAEAPAVGTGPGTVPGAGG